LKIMNLSGEQRRQLIDTQQAYDAWRAAKADSNRRFAGSMRWGERNGKEYLLRKIGKTERSLGFRSKETEAAYEAFLRGRSENSDRLAGLSERLDKLAPVNVAMGLGRMPSIGARIVRACDEQGLLGEQLIVVGMNAMFAYEVQKRAYCNGRYRSALRRKAAHQLGGNRIGHGRPDGPFEKG
jgi:hypothetical protein